MPIHQARRPLNRMFPVLGAILLLGLAGPTMAQPGAAPSSPPPPAPSQGDSDVVAQRGDTKLTVGDVRDLLDHLDGATRAQLQSNPAAMATFVRDRLLKLVLLAEAKSKGFDQLQDVVVRANEARDGVIVSSFVNSLIPADPNFPNQAEITATYDANKAKFMLPKQYHFAQIAFPLPQNATQAQDDEAKKHAQEARALAIKPKADFAELARKLSQEKNSAQNGGDLGWVREDQLQPSLRGMVAAMNENGVSEAIRTQTAWVVLKLLGTRPPGPAPLSEVQEQLIQAMRQTRAQQASQNFIADMLRKEPIQLNEIDLARKLAAPH
jgi:peptidylprolyl isomerase